MLSKDAISRSALALFDEAYTGTAEGAIWFTDGDARSGFAGLLAGISAEEASRPLTPGDPLTAASHAAHVVYALSFAAAMAKGERPETDWSGSWAAREVTEAEWKALVARLAAAAAEVRKVFESGVFLADDVLDNSGTLDALEAAVAQLHARYIALAAARGAGVA